MGFRVDSRSWRPAHDSGDERQQRPDDRQADGLRRNLQGGEPITGVLDRLYDFASFGSRPFEGLARPSHREPVRLPGTAARASLARQPLSAREPGRSPWQPALDTLEPLAQTGCYRGSAGLARPDRYSVHRLEKDVAPWFPARDEGTEPAYLIGP